MCISTDLRAVTIIKIGESSMIRIKQPAASSPCVHGIDRPSPVSTTPKCSVLETFQQIQFAGLRAVGIQRDAPWWQPSPLLQPVLGGKGRPPSRLASALVNRRMPGSLRPAWGGLRSSSSRSGHGWCRMPGSWVPARRGSGASGGVPAGVGAYRRSPPSTRVANTVGVIRADQG